MTTLESLEQKSGRVHTVAERHSAREKAEQAPATLTDVDIALIEHFDGEKAGLEALYASRGLPKPGATREASHAATPKPAAAKTYKGLGLFDIVRGTVDKFDDDLPTELPDTPILSPAMLEALEKFPVELRPAAEVLSYVLCQAGHLRRKNVLRNRLIRDLEKRIADLEARPSIEYRGVFEQGRAYGAGSLCTRAGSLWLATTDTTLVPGTSPSWRLIVKQGRAE